MLQTQTFIHFDLSKIQKLSMQEAFEKVRGAVLRELTKVSFEHKIRGFYFESLYDSSIKEDLDLPDSIILTIISKQALEFTQNKHLNKNEAHTLIPVRYSMQETDQKITKPKSSGYILYLEKSLPSDQYDLQNASRVFELTSQAKTLDEKIKEALGNKDLRKRIESKYYFFDQAIQAYEANKLNLVLPEAWPGKKIMCIIRSEKYDELSLFSLLCLKIQYERSHGKTVVNILTETPQQEPLHIGLFGVYQTYLDTLEAIVHRIESYNQKHGFFRRKFTKKTFLSECAYIFKEVKSRLEAYILAQLYGAIKIDPLRQNAWINLLLRLKDFFQWSEGVYFPEEGEASTEWIIFKEDIDSNGESYFKIDDIFSRPFYMEYSQNRYNALVKELYKDFSLDIEVLMRELEEEVSQGIYIYADDQSFSGCIFHALKDILKSDKQSQDSFVSGLGCHLELTEELTEKDLTLMCYTSLTPVGHFMPLRSFHDGAWRSSTWLRAHDSFHAGAYVRIFERMGCDISDTSIDRYKNIDQIDSYLYMVHKILSLSEEPLKRLTQSDRNYIRIYLFMAHELKLSTRDMDLLNAEDSLEHYFNRKSLIVILQDLLYRMNIKIEGKVASGQIETILPGKYELDIVHGYAAYKKIKRDALVEYINEKLLVC